MAYLIPQEGDGLLPYSGEFIESKLVEWILRNAAPVLGELSFTSTAGKILYNHSFLYLFVKL